MIKRNSLIIRSKERKMSVSGSVMRKILLLIILLSSVQFGQVYNSQYFVENGEAYFRFRVFNKAEINQLSVIMSIDKVTEDCVYAYANEKEFKSFLKYGYDYEALKHPGDVPVVMTNTIEGIEAWDSYPTYDVYVQMLYQYQELYPNICRIVDAGTTVQGRKILFAIISDNVNLNEDEPEFMFSSTMHGDEATGYVLMLRLIDSLLNGYGTNARITNLVNNMEIWINPNANPDGTYRNGNNTLSGARRYNYNGIDINRNFPDPADGLHPDGSAWQPETIAMMNLATQKNFVLSCNFHGGVEVVNYPWDTWSRLHPDNNWYFDISRKYADTVHAHAPSTYMSDFVNGITNGYAWYRITGGRQDYFTYFKRGREVTIEISNTKLISASLLPAHWEYNKRSFLNYMEETLEGLRGVITNPQGAPVKAKITIQGHDFDNSEIYSDTLSGNYHRMISPGTYTVVISADSHYTKTFTNITVTAGGTTTLNAVLDPTNPTPVELTAFTAVSNGGKVTIEWETATETNNKGFEISIRKKEDNKPLRLIWVDGKGTTTERSGYKVENTFEKGVYMVGLRQVDFDGTSEKTPEIEVTVESPASFALHQNYPNPFNPSTVIGYSLPAESKVVLRVYDLLGREIATLVNKVQQAGEHAIEFNSSGLSTGVYFYRIETFDNGGKLTYAGTAKMLLNK